MSEFFAGFFDLWAIVMDSPILRFMLFVSIILFSVSTFFRMFFAFTGLDPFYFFSAIFSAISRWIKKLFSPLWARFLAWITVQAPDQEDR